MSNVDPLAEVTASLASVQLIPDVVPPSASFSPSVLFSVVWPSGKRASLGNELTRDDTLDEPDVVFTPMGTLNSGEGGSETSYTLVMCDRAQSRNIRSSGTGWATESKRVGTLAVFLHARQRRGGGYDIRLYLSPTARRHDAITRDVAPERARNQRLRDTSMKGKVRTLHFAVIAKADDLRASETRCWRHRKTRNRSDWEGWWRAAKRGGDMRRREGNDDRKAVETTRRRSSALSRACIQRARWNTDDCETITAAAQLRVSKASLRTSFSSDPHEQSRYPTRRCAVGYQRTSTSREFWTLGIVSSTPQVERRDCARHRITTGPSYESALHRAGTGIRKQRATIEPYIDAVTIITPENDTMDRAMGTATQTTLNKGYDVKRRPGAGEGERDRGVRDDR
ncbi:hypothetical protein EYR36_004116 [Pleurotus pulmonarius]|nr:hypothetical protein EYR36_004116 [Pleurotus pulmonarius]